MSLRTTARRDIRRILTREGDLAEHVVYRTAVGDIDVRGVWAQESPAAEDEIGAGRAIFHGRATLSVHVDEILSPQDGAVILRTLPSGETERWNITEVTQHQTHSWLLTLERPRSEARAPGRRIR